jgi:peptidoglycan hydrolase-like protein with peptidoglycan-binding domain
MVYKLTWLPDVLLAAGLKVSRVVGWETRGRREMGTVVGVMCHHTAGPGAAKGTMASLNVLINGRTGLPGPLAQLGLGRDGTFYVIAAGVANHAGPGKWKGQVDTGNSRFVGIEAENTGKVDDTWPDVQMDAYVRGAAALLRQIKADPIMCVAHREWAPTRKPDPSFVISMTAFRDQVAAVMNGTAITRPMIPATATGETGSTLATLRRGANGTLVERLQAALRAPVDGRFGAGTEAMVRAFQREKGLVPDGIVGPKTWAAIEAALGPIQP